MAVLEPDLGRLIIAHSDQRELWVKKKRLLEPDLGRFNRGVNRPQPGSLIFFLLTPIAPAGRYGL